MVISLKEKTEKFYMKCVFLNLKINFQKRSYGEGPTWKENEVLDGHL